MTHPKPAIKIPLELSEYGLRDRCAVCLAPIPVTRDLCDKCLGMVELHETDRLLRGGWDGPWTRE